MIENLAGHRLTSSLQSTGEVKCVNTFVDSTSLNLECKSYVNFNYRYNNSLIS